MDDSNNKLPYFFLGIGIGFAAGLLFAPKSGEETRALLKEKAEEGRERLRRQAEDLQHTAEDFVERSKEAVLKQREQFNSAIEAGKQAYREAVSKIAPEQENA